MLPRASRLHAQRLTGRVAHWHGGARANRWARAWVLWLACALWLAPLLSRLHQTLHLGHSHAAVLAKAPALTAAAVAAADATTERSLWERLFSPHVDGASVCQLLDHGSTPQGAGPQTPATVFDRPTACCPDTQPLAEANGPLAFFLARGPPAFL